MTIGVDQPRSPVGKHRTTILPTTVLGRLGVGLAAAFLPLVFAAGVIPGAAALGIVCGLVGGIAAMTAIVRDRERALTAYAALAPLAVAVAFVLAQLV